MTYIPFDLDYIAGDGSIEMTESQKLKSNPTSKVSEDFVILLLHFIVVPPTSKTTECVKYSSIPVRMLLQPKNCDLASQRIVCSYNH